MEVVRIPNNPGPVRGELTVPGSKSITNRALIMAALAEGSSVLENALFSDDTIYMMEALEHSGISLLSVPEHARIEVDGGLSRLALSPDQPLFVGNAGTAMRFLTAMFSLTRQHYELTGSERMKQRPIGELLDAIAALGGDATSRNSNGCPPVIINGRGLAGGEVHFSGRVSSQFISALMMAAPYARQDVRIVINDEPVSVPYLEMTAGVMAAFGVHTQQSADRRCFTVTAGQRYLAGRYQVECDASSASYFLATAAVSRGRVQINGLGRASIQGDIRFLDLLEQMGCSVESGDNWVAVSGPDKLQGIDVDMRHISDMTLTLACVALFAQGPTTIRGVANIRFKETDRIKALCTELTRLGADVSEREDGLVIRPAPEYQAAAIKTYDDHRMAMSFAVAGLRIPGLEILDPQCTSKTFPDFFPTFLRLVNGAQA